MNRPLYPSGPCARTEPSRHHPRHDWTEAEAREIHDLPFPEFLFHAQPVHRRHFDRAEIETATLLSIKVGGCPEDCGYCSQSAKWNTGVEASKLMQVESVLAEARREGRRRLAVVRLSTGRSP